MIFLISKEVLIIQCDVCGGVIYISNKSKYLTTEMRYATAVKTNLYNFKTFFSNKVSFKPNFSFHIPFKKVNYFLMRLRNLQMIKQKIYSLSGDLGNERKFNFHVISFHFISFRL